MRLYVDTNQTKRKLTLSYTPDTLIVDNISYDIAGDIDVDTDEGGMHCRVKGEILKIKNNGDIIKLTKKSAERLITNLQDTTKTNIIAVYPFEDNDEWTDEQAYGDLCDLDGTATLMINIAGQEQEVSFKFVTEFYGK